jgi:hypothetical protein
MKAIFTLAPTLGPLTPVSAGALVPVPPSLNTLAAKFRDTHNTMKSGVRASVAEQIECGRLLDEMQALIKKEIGAGYWRVWVEANCGVTLRQVQRYTRKHREYTKLEAKIGGQALDLLARGEMGQEQT